MTNYLIYPSNHISVIKLNYDHNKQAIHTPLHTTTPLSSSPLHQVQHFTRLHVLFSACSVPNI